MNLRVCVIHKLIYHHTKEGTILRVTLILGGTVSWLLVNQKEDLSIPKLYIFISFKILHLRGQEGTVRKSFYPMQLGNHDSSYPAQHPTHFKEENSNKQYSFGFPML